MWKLWLVIICATNPCSGPGGSEVRGPAGGLTYPTYEACEAYAKMMMPVQGAVYECSNQSAEGWGR